MTILMLVAAFVALAMALGSDYLHDFSVGLAITALALCLFYRWLDSLAKPPFGGAPHPEIK